MLIIVKCRDTLFFDDFNLSKFLSLLDSLPVRETEGALVTCYNCKDEGMLIYASTEGLKLA